MTIGVNTKENDFFLILYYKNMGDKYQLFSTGFDNIPYTADDVHPDFSAIDTTKLGITLKSE